MNYDEEEEVEERGFRVSEEDEDEFLEPVIGSDDFDANEFEEEDPDKDH